jgi:hypothetical protein
MDVDDQNRWYVTIGFVEVRPSSLEVTVISVSLLMSVSACNAAGRSKFAVFHDKFQKTLYCWVALIQRFRSQLPPGTTGRNCDGQLRLARHSLSPPPFDASFVFRELQQHPDVRLLPNLTGHRLVSIYLRSRRFCALVLAVNREGSKSLCSTD